MALWLTDDDAANELLGRDPLALLLAMALDQHVVAHRNNEAWMSA